MRAAFGCHRRWRVPGSVTIAPLRRQSSANHDPPSLLAPGDAKALLPDGISYTLTGGFEVSIVSPPSFCG